jgi:RNA polymerase sigma-70 factor (ECF subfamily)
MKPFNRRPENEISDEELARQAQAGSHAGFETLVCRYSGRLFQFLNKRFPVAQDAEDITQETFIKAYLNIHRFNPDYSFSTWLYTIAARQAISHYRSARWKMDQRTGTHSEGMDIPASNSPEEVMTGRENRRFLWEHAKSMKKEFYEVLWLKYVEEKPVKEIAVILNRSRINVRVLLHRARSKLAGLVTQTEGVQRTNSRPEQTQKENYDVLFST